MRARRSAGFTMIELMVTVSILGILAALMLSNFRRNPAGDEARRIAAAMSTALRVAVQGGAVRADVSSAEGGTRARAMLEIVEESGGYQVKVWRLKEDDLPNHGYGWESIEIGSISTEVEILRVSDSAQIGLATTQITAGGVPASKLYYPNGSADSFTVYIRQKDNPNGARYRVVGLPLSPAPQVFLDW